MGLHFSTKVIIIYYGEFNQGGWEWRGEEGRGGGFEHVIFFLAKSDMMSFLHLS
jgi:hypothetical protein